uniref:Uncharacterized protein n=1 Tax=Arundo donax TaxID=35708 RepID=A0A0A9AW85_ARUDO
MCQPKSCGRLHQEGLQTRHIKEPVGTNMLISTSH